MQTTNKIYKVTCGSSVPHLMCFECEGEWRYNMTLQDGPKIITCPTCRQPERERTVESMKREFIRELDTSYSLNPSTMQSMVPEV